MKLGFARAGLWFAGTLAVLLLFPKDFYKQDTHTSATLLFSGVIAFVIAAAVFFYTWYNELLDEKEDEAERRRAEHTSSAD